MDSHKILIVLALCLGINSCVFKDDFDKIPAYLSIDTIEFETTIAQGANTHNFKDIWVTVDGDLVGVFTPPVDIPIILNESGVTDVLLAAGIRNNGVNSSNFRYEFTKTINEQLSLEPGEVLEYTPVFRYQDNLEFKILEDFEGNHIFNQDVDDFPETSLMSTSEEARSGQKSGVITLDQDHFEGTVATPFFYNPNEILGGVTYLEFDYKSDIPFFVGYIKVEGSLASPQPLVIINSKDEWNHIYVDLSLELASSTLDAYNIFLGAELNDTSIDTAKVYFDNVKLLYFN